MARQELAQVRGHADRAHARSAAAVRDAKSFVQVQVGHVGAQLTGLRQSHQRVHVGAVHVHLAPVFVNQPADFAERFFEHPVGRRVSHHQARQSRAVEVKLGAQVIHVDAAAVVGRYHHHLESGHHRAGGIGAVGRSRDQTNVAPGLAARLQILADHQQPRVLTLRTRVGLHADRGEPGDLGQPPLQLTNQAEVPPRLIERRKRVDATELGAR